MKDKNRRWDEELLMVLWVDKTNEKGEMGHTTYSIVFGYEEVIPPKVIIPTKLQKVTTKV